MFETSKLNSTSSDQKPTNSTKDYVRTSDQQKLELIDLVINEKYSMKLASEIVGVKLSTVKYIVKAYRTDKQCFMAKVQQKKAKVQKQKKKDIDSVQIKPLSDEKPSNHIFTSSTFEPNIFQMNHQIIPIYSSNSGTIPFQTYFQPNQFWNHYSAIQNAWGFGSFEN